MQLQQALMAPPESPLAAAAPARARAVVWGGPQGRGKSLSPGTRGRMGSQAAQAVAAVAATVAAIAGPGVVDVPAPPKTGVGFTADVAALEHYREVAQKVVAQRRRVLDEQREYEVGHRVCACGCHHTCASP